LQLDIKEPSQRLLLELGAAKLNQSLANLGSPIHGKVTNSTDKQEEEREATPIESCKVQ